jgi:lipopolysaccharide export system ATP-binding protein
MLEAMNLAKSYRGRPVVDHVSLGVAPGQVVGLLGPNGAGKTTCFDMLVGLIPLDEGAIHLDGHDISGLPIHLRARRGLGYLPQEASVFRRLDVAANIRAALELRKDLRAFEREGELDALLEDLQIAHLRDQRGQTLSGGERRRVEIARALAADPVYMLLDEPFAGVDPIAVAEIRRIVAHLTERGLGVLITDHNVRETLSLCHHAYILSAGRILAEGTPEAILRDPGVREVYLGKDFKLG